MSRPYVIGTESFPVLIEKNAWYVDKTAWLREIFLGSSDDQCPLFIRPRRFGKTLNMSMIKAFCELNYHKPGDTTFQEKLFLDNGRNLAVAGKEYRELREQFMGAFPVIFFSFRGIAGSTIQEALTRLLERIAVLYRNFYFLHTSTRITSIDRKAFLSDFEFCRSNAGKLYEQRIFSRAVQIAGSFLPNLASLLHAEYQKQVIVIIDEYDVPLQKALVAENPYYDKILDIIKNISVNTFKQDADPWLYKGIVTGCLRIAHQSIFTDANNFRTIGMDTAGYEGFFGFTEEETAKLLEECGLADRKQVVHDWYDGYLFGNERMFCPWSVLNYCEEASRRNCDPNFKPQAYWVNTSGNDILRLYLQHGQQGDLGSDLERLQKLLDGEPQEICLQEFTTYPDIRNDAVSFDTFLTLLLYTGYVTYTFYSHFHQNVVLQIPNLEVRESFVRKVQLLYSRANPAWFNITRALIKAFMTHASSDAQILLNKLLSTFVSVRSTGQEAYYHGFIQGVLISAATSLSLEISSELETGDGYADLTLFDPGTLGAVVLEFKSGENNQRSRVRSAEKAARQIVVKNYVQKFCDDGAASVLGYGIGFGGKYCALEDLGELLCNADSLIPTGKPVGLYDNPE